MTASEANRNSNRKRPPFVVIIIVLLFFGLHGFYRVMQSAHFESYRTLDVIQLVLSGACFGAVLVIVMMKLLLPHT